MISCLAYQVQESIIVNNKGTKKRRNWKIIQTQEKTITIKKNRGIFVRKCCKGICGKPKPVLGCTLTYDLRLPIPSALPGDNLALRTYPLRKRVCEIKIWKRIARRDVKNLKIQVLKVCTFNS